MFIDNAFRLSKMQMRIYLPMESGDVVMTTITEFTTNYRINFRRNK